MGYVIKVTYTSGEHEGYSYFLMKGGYVAREKEYILECNQYKTKGMAQRICNQYFESNEQDYRIERNSNEWNITHGRKPKEFFLHEHKTYEPYEV